MIINYPTFLYKPITAGYITLTISSNEPIKDLNETVPFINIPTSAQLNFSESTDELVEISIFNSTNINSAEFFDIDDIVFSDEVPITPKNILININNKRNIYSEQYLDNHLKELIVNLNNNIVLYRNKCNEYNDLDKILININRKLVHIVVIDQISDIIKEDVKKEIKDLQTQKIQTINNMENIRIEIFVLISKIKKLKNAL